MNRWIGYGAVALVVAVVVVARWKSGRQEGRGGSIPVAEDRSLSVEEYTARGLADVGRAWTGDDYDKAIQVLGQVAAEDAKKLPRRGSARSGKVFERIVSRENFAVLGDKRVAVETRGPLVRGALGSLEILQVYIQASQKGEVFPAELVELYCLGFHVNASAAEVSKEYVDSLGFLDFSKAKREEARVAMLKALTQAAREMMGAMKSPAFGVADRMRLAEEMRLELPRFMKFLNPAQRQAVLRDLEELAKAQGDKKVAGAIRGVAEACPK